MRASVRTKPGFFDEKRFWEASLAAACHMGSLSNTVSLTWKLIGFRFPTFRCFEKKNLHPTPFFSVRVVNGWLCAVSGGGYSLVAAEWIDWKPTVVVLCSWG